MTFINARYMHWCYNGETINTININFNTNMLLNGCPLYSEDVNGEIFDILVQRFIVESDRF